MITIEKDFSTDEKTEYSLRYCQKEDVLVAFMAVGAEIRTKCGRFAVRGITLPEACHLARRIREQRDLLKQIVGYLNRGELKRLLRFNRKLRGRLCTMAATERLSSSVIMPR